MNSTPPFAAAIAGNRFGLGIRPGGSVAVDCPANLLAQFDRFDPRPAVIASVPGSAVMARQFREYLAAIRPLLRANGFGGPAMDGEAADAPPVDPAEVRKALRQQYRDDYGAQARARIAAALTTPAPFPERLVHFWANHFAVSADKLQTIGLAGTLEFEAIRPNIGGRFVDLLIAVERHPAMLLYLDQAQSIGPGSFIATAARRRGAKR